MRVHECYSTERRNITLIEHAERPSPTQKTAPSSDADTRGKIQSLGIWVFLKEDNFLDYHFADFGINKLGHAGLSHKKFVLERGGGKAHKEPALVHVHLLCFERDGFTHYLFPARYYRHLIQFALEAVSTY
jgi:hypothetical protein